MLKKTAVFIVFFLAVNSNVFAQTQSKDVADKKFWAVSVLLVGSTIYDVESTYFALDRCRTCREANPFMRPVVEAGRPWLYAVQGSIDTGVIYHSYQMKKKNSKLWYILPVAMAAVHSVAGANNIRLVIKF